ncbi:DNA binding domain, excisionase family [Parafrankia sp. Ea1.12]|uniref:helix-turn-helix domain-containing protein n=1 Tax=Parafrankia sp. Ea1.12 TaxID=573499 RepID=UPI000DA49D2E|nr:helix-turn-helix domain-containing protein [Parafrankia sp. Ea1.12]SQD94582.1 DNA binding domain, excisionase family [Parafrankia sp. Ea1.12]
MSKLLLTVDEAAALLGIGRSTVYDLIRGRRLESVRIGRARRVPRTAVLAYIDRLRGDGEAA